MGLGERTFERWGQARDLPETAAILLQDDVSVSFEHIENVSGSLGYRREIRVFAKFLPGHRPMVLVDLTPGYFA
jgi:hypothetical protein